MLNTLGKKRGFTLIELVVSISIAGLILLALVSFSALTANLNLKANDLGQAQSFARINLQMIEGQLRFAESLNIDANLPSTLKNNIHYIFAQNGIIKKQTGGFAAESIVPKGFEEFTCGISFAPVNPKVIEVSLSVFKQGAKVYSISERIFLNNLISESITGGLQGGCISYKLTGIPISSILITSPGSSIDGYGQTLQMSASIYPSNAENKGVAWSVDKPDYAVINQDGLLTPLKNGTVTVTATALDGSGITGTKQILIRNQKVPVTNLELTTATGETSLPWYGHKLQIIASITPSDATNKLITWSVDNTNYATINSYGVLTSGEYKNKSVIVTAATNDGSDIIKTIEIRITG